MLAFVPALGRLGGRLGGDMDAPGAGPANGSYCGPEKGAGFDWAGWRAPACPFAIAPGRRLAEDGARGRSAVVPGAATLLRPGVVDLSIPGEVRAASAAGTSDGREGAGTRGDATRGGSDGPGGDGNGTLSVLGLPSRARGLGTRSGRLSPLRTLKVEADDGARGRPTDCGGAGLFWRDGPWEIDDVRGGLCNGGGPFTRL